MRAVGLIFVALVMVACATKNDTSMKKEVSQYADDPHSYSIPNEVAMTHLSLDLNVDFEKRILKGKATYDLERNKGNKFILDLDGIQVQSVNDGKDQPLEFKIVAGNEMGDALHIDLHNDTEQVTVSYETSSGASALLWLNPEQTLSKTDPFLFTQGQAILTRSWIPIQDTPSLRITYDAQVSVPKGLLAIMSATNPQDLNETSSYSFKMEQPIPPYLMALAVGKLEFAPLGDRSGVYAEPAILEEAAYEFADVEKMIDAAEELYGPYRWERYDILVLPPSFPFGGMENPRLTFATPTIIAGDRSLTSLIAHELAHSWSGNLVTNATWNDFWLNEGFTVYFEKRIMEAIYGKDYAEMLNELGQQDLMHTIDELGKDSADTRLKLNLGDRNPDDGMTDIAYEKGYLFLRSLEETVGRERFDQFLRNYFDENAFKTMTTEQFVEYLDDNLLSELEVKPDIDSWIYEAGLPAEYPHPESTLFDKVDSVRLAWQSGEVAAKDLSTTDWSTHEWLHFLRGLRELNKDKMAELDATFDFTNSGNSEIAAEWFELAIKNDYKTAYPKMEEFLIRVGRRKFLKPLYVELAKDTEDLEWARKVYAKARPNYHSVSTETIDKILKES
jgi:leukotriene A-4 hydrolase/aminopeptidase